MDASLRAKLEGLPLFSDRPLEGWHVKPLGGLTNRNLKLSRDGESYVLRLGGEGTARYIDRAREAFNMRTAVALGLCPEVLFFDRADGTMLTRFIDGAAPFDGDRLRDPASLRAAVGVLKRLHSSGCSFRGEMILFAKLDVYRALARETEPAIVAALKAACLQAEPLRAALEKGREALVPCHIDPAPHNFIEGRGRVYLIDWEYSAMSEPMWDIGDLSVEAGFDPDQDAAMLETYYGAASSALAGRLVLYKAALDLLGAAWGAVQIADGNDTTDFRAFVAERLARFHAALDDVSFARHVENAAG
ncbi:choline/ethanolamine kinase family protein [Rhodospirillaceae bacterium SYSU D60014]|uniref:phosphotransferase n=1 Tax=Virgifigura deserti TaxID=2268457 RepID=UPI000E66C577